MKKIITVYHSPNGGVIADNLPKTKGHGLGYVCGFVPPHYPVPAIPITTAIGPDFVASLTWGNGKPQGIYLFTK